MDYKVVVTAEAEEDLNQFIQYLLFAKKNNLEPNMVSEEVDMELLMKALANPEMRALLNSLAKTMK